MPPSSDGKHTRERNNIILFASVPLHGALCVCTPIRIELVGSQTERKYKTIEAIGTFRARATSGNKSQQQQQTTTKIECQGFYSVFEQNKLKKKKQNPSIELDAYTAARTIRARSLARAPNKL